jgi:hypothetical protein
MCLASGKTTVACDALMRLLAHTGTIQTAEQEAAIRKIEASQFAKFDCKPLKYKV